MSIKPASYLPTLDGWRAIAIALVVCAHSSDSVAHFFQIQDQNLIQWLKNIGLFGVKIFFGLSGFLITTNLLNEEHRAGTISLKSFYIRRIFRILPVSFLFIIVAGILIFCDVIDVTWSRWLSTLFLMANYTSAPGNWYMGHFWSLAVEEHFYLLWPAFFFYLKFSDKRINFVLSAALVVSLWRAFDFKFRISGSDLSVFWGRTDIQADNIIWGVFVALIYNYHIFRKLVIKIYTDSNYWVLLFLLLFIFQFSPSFGWKSDFLRLSVVSIIIPLLIVGTVINHSCLFGRILENRAVKWVGKISFSLYLWQQLFLVWDGVAVAWLSGVQMFPANVLAAVTVATVSYYLVERPFIKMGHRLLARRSSFALNSDHV